VQVRCSTLSRPGLPVRKGRAMLKEFGRRSARGLT
jgi:hypothetical protein